MPWPNETMPVFPTSRLSEVANSAMALSRMTKSSKAGLRWNSGIASTTIRATARSPFRATRGGVSCPATEQALRTQEQDSDHQDIDQAIGELGKADRAEAADHADQQRRDQRFPRSSPCPDHRDDEALDQNREAMPGDSERTGAASAPASPASPPRSQRRSRKAASCWTPSAETIWGLMAAAAHRLAEPRHRKAEASTIANQRRNPRSARVKGRHHAAAMKSGGTWKAAGIPHGVELRPPHDLHEVVEDQYHGVTDAKSCISRWSRRRDLSRRVRTAREQRIASAPDSTAGCSCRLREGGIGDVAPSM